jgi:hypothetical protein
MKRHRDAIAIDNGAVNPRAIVNALRNAIDEMDTPDLMVGTNTILDDPAFRLMVHQLAHLTRVLNFQDYMEAREFCEKEAGE